VLDKTVPTAAAAVADIRSGSTIAVGGFGMCGVPITLIDALYARDVGDFEIVSNNCGSDGWGLGKMLSSGRVRRVIGSFVGENREMARQYLAGELELELTPQGSLAERLRAGGAGIPAFYTKAGVGTMVADGGLPWRYNPDGSVAIASAPKQVSEFDGETFVLERAIVADVALVHAWRGDRHGNLVYRHSASNFNPVCASSARLTIAEVEELVEPGEIDPMMVHTPGIFVTRIVAVPDAVKAIEKLTVSRRGGR
jgi:3-oxoacid CoA-transferase subunit A